MRRRLRRSAGLVAVTCGAILLAGCDLGAPRVTVSGYADKVIAGDLDGDGDLDLVVLRNQWHLSALVNDGSASFTSVDYGTGVYNEDYGDLALVDLDHDGHLDLVTTATLPAYETGGDVHVRLNDGTGAFGERTIVRGPGGPRSEVATGDIDGDGHPDVVVAADTLGAFVVYQGDGTGSLAGGVTHALPSNFVPQSIAVFDADGDGVDDVVTGGSLGEPGEAALVVTLADGTGGFAPPATYTSDAGALGAFAVGSADVDGDGTVDLVAGNGTPEQYGTAASLSVLSGTGDGTFDAAVVTDVEASVVEDVKIDDIDGDGLLDVVAAVGTDGAFVYFGNGLGTFPDAEYLHPSARPVLDGAVGDFDGDGVTDVVTAGAGVDLFPNRLEP
jgi:hypothetical protein